MISVICVYNNKAVLCNCLLKGLDRQSADYELILLDNTGNNYRSAAEALNKGGRDAKGDYLMFAHQDVQLFSKDWLENVESRLRLLPNLGIAGVAGNLEMIKGLVSNLKHGEPPRLAGNIEIERPEKVQTLDECLILIPRAVFFLQKFDKRPVMIGIFMLWIIASALRSWDMMSMSYQIMFIISLWAIYQKDTIAH
jgi:hypothetical protein